MKWISQIFQGFKTTDMLEIQGFMAYTDTPTYCISSSAPRVRF
jgi:hypothetical protein